MSNNLYKLFKLSLKIRNLTVLSNHVIAKRAFSVFPQCKNIYEEQNFPLQVSGKQGSNTQQNLFKAFFNCKNENEVFEIIRKHNKEMNGIEAKKALEMLFEADKAKEKTDVRTITQKKEFSILCEVLKKNIRDLSHSEAINSLKVLNYFNVPTSTVIVQMLLQIIRHNVNQLSIEQIIFLEFLLQKCQKVPLVEAFEIALPIVFQYNLKLKLDLNNINSLISTLKYLSRKKDIDQDSLHYVLSALNRIDEQLFTTDNSLNLMKILLNLNVSNLPGELFERVKNKLVNSINELSEYDILSLLYHFANDEYRTRDQFDFESLIDVCISTVISKDMGFKTAVECLNYLTGVFYSNNSLLDYISAKCFENQETLKMIDIRVIRTIIKGLALADYKPIFWDTLKELLYDPRILDLNFGALITISVDFATLDCYWSELLTMVFTKTTTDIKYNDSDQRKLLLLKCAVEKFYPEYNGPWPSEEILQICNSLITKRKCSESLKLSLECSLGGPQYISSNLKTNFGFFLDHAIILRKGGYPVALNNFSEPQVQHIDQLNAPLDSQIIIFMFIHKFGIVSNTQRFTGLWSLIIRLLKTDPKYTVIPVLETEWKKLTEKEQVQYVSQAIKLKYDELSAMV